MEVQKESVLRFLLDGILSERVLRRFLQTVPFAWGNDQMAAAWGGGRQS